MVFSWAFPVRIASDPKLLGLYLLPVILRIAVTDYVMNTYFVIIMTTRKQTDSTRMLLPYLFTYLQTVNL